MPGWVIRAFSASCRAAWSGTGLMSAPPTPNTANETSSQTVITTVPSRPARMIRFATFTSSRVETPSEQQRGPHAGDEDVSVRPSLLLVRTRNQPLHVRGYPEQPVDGETPVRFDELLGPGRLALVGVADAQAVLRTLPPARRELRPARAGAGGHRFIPAPAESAAGEHADGRRDRLIDADAGAPRPASAVVIHAAGPHPPLPAPGRRQDVTAPHLGDQYRASRHIAAEFVGRGPNVRRRSQCLPVSCRWAETESSQSEHTAMRMRRVRALPVVLLLCGPAAGTAPASQDRVSRQGTVAADYARAVALFNEHDDTGEAIAEAETAFARLLARNPRHAPSRAYQGLIALERGLEDAADAAFRDALAVDTACAEAHVGRVRLLRARGRWRESYDEARLAVRLAPSSVLARWELVNVLCHRAEAPIGDAERNEAIPHLLRIIELQTAPRQAHLDLADIYREQHRWREAIPHYLEVLRIGQTSEDSDVWVYAVHQTVADCYDKIGDDARAADSLEKYLRELRTVGADDETRSDVERRLAELRKKAARRDLVSTV